MFNRIALRIVVQEALRGHTNAGDNVLDSQFSAIDTDNDGSLRTDQDRPFFSIYTDNGTGSASNGSGDLFGPASVELVIEAGISTAMTDLDPDTGLAVVVGLGLPPTDAVMEMALDVMMRQAADALTDYENPWADLFRELLHITGGVDRARVGQAANGTRLAAHEMRIRGTLVGDPIKGQDLADTTFGRFLDALEQSGRPRLIKVRAAMQAVLAGDVADWELVMRELGLSNGQASALGIAPTVADAGELSEVSVEIEGRQP